MLLRVTDLLSGLFRPKRGLNLRRCLWKALPKVSQNGLRFFFSTQLFLLRTLPSGHKEEEVCSGCVPASVRTRKVSFCFWASRPCPHQVSLQPEKTQCLPLTSSRVGGSLAAGSPAAFHFQFALSRGSGEDSERRFGKSGITFRARRPSDPPSRFSPLPGLKASPQRFLGVSASPSLVSYLIPKKFLETPEILFSKSRDTCCFSNSARTGANSKSPIQENRTCQAKQRPGDTFNQVPVFGRLSKMIFSF